MKKFHFFIIPVLFFCLESAYAFKPPAPLAFFVNQSIHCADINVPASCSSVPAGFSVYIYSADSRSRPETFKLSYATYNEASVGISYHYAGNYDNDFLLLSPIVVHSPFQPVEYPGCLWQTDSSYNWTCNSSDPKKCPYAKTWVSEKDIHCQS